MWFKALTEPVFMFQLFGVYGLDAKKEFTGRDYIDPIRGGKIKRRAIGAKRLNAKKAYKLYGKSYNDR